MDMSYFHQLNRTLKNYHRAIPSLIIDLDRLDQNLDTLLQSLRPGLDFRIVVKSLPSSDLIRYLMDKSGSQKLMVFHQPFLSDLSRWLDGQADVLLGKPMPVKTAAYFYETVRPEKGFDPFRQIQWLVDTGPRARQYLNLAQNLGHPLRLNLEIDVGLHRGGFGDLESLGQVLQLISDHPEELKLSGLMGYEPHVVKLPRLLRSSQRAFRMADDFYTRCIALIREQFPALWHGSLTFNGGGSPTLALHGDRPSALNEVSAGSCLVKPTTFDIPTLDQYQAAGFIATPILKKLKHTTLPGLEKVANWISHWKPTYRYAYFIYGGYWMADYVFPEGTKENPLFGPSTNQSMINMPKGQELAVDDFVFLRPRQSESVFLQFGDLLAYRKGEILHEWASL